MQQEKRGLRLHTPVESDVPDTPSATETVPPPAPSTVVWPERTPFDVHRIKAVAFDAYGTLFNFHNEEFLNALTVILSDQNLAVDDAEAFYKSWVELYGRASVWHEHWQNGRPDPNLTLNGPLPEWHSTWEIWRRQFGLAFEKYGVHGDAEAAATYVRDQLAAVTPYPDAYDTIESLAQRGYLLGLLSNADEDFLQSALSRGRLRFSVIQSSESLRAYKPHRAIFMALCQRFALAPDEVLYVGDSANADMRGALNAGLRTAWLRRQSGEIDRYPEGAPLPDVTIEQLGDLLSVLADRR